MYYIKSGRTISRATRKQLQLAHDHMDNSDHYKAQSLKFIIKAVRHGAKAKALVKDLMRKGEDIADVEEEDESDEEARRRKEEDESGSTGLNPLSSAASEYDHMRSGGLRVLTPEFYSIEKLVMGSDRITVVAEDTQTTYVIDEQKFGEAVQQSVGSFLKRTAERAAVIAINRAKGRVD